MVFMKRQRMKYLLALWSKLQICKIPHRHLLNYVKEMYLSAARLFFVIRPLVILIYDVVIAVIIS